MVTEGGRGIVTVTLGGDGASTSTLGTRTTTSRGASTSTAGLAERLPPLGAAPVDTGAEPNVVVAGSEGCSSSPPQPKTAGTLRSESIRNKEPTDRMGTSMSKGTTPNTHPLCHANQLDIP